MASFLDTGRLLGLWIILFLLFIAIVVIDPAPVRPRAIDDPEIQQQRTYSTQAYVCARAHVKNLLKAPRTAEFPFRHSNSPNTVWIRDDQYRVASYVDAQNSFGALIRTPYTCIVTYRHEPYYCNATCLLDP